MHCTRTPGSWDCRAVVLQPKHGFIGISLDLVPVDSSYIASALALWEGDEGNKLEQLRLHLGEQLELNRLWDAATIGCKVQEDIVIWH